MTKEKNLMAATWTKAAKVRRALKAGRQRQKDLKYSCERAAIEGYILLIEMRKEMLRAGLKDEDVRVALILITPESDKEGTIRLFPVSKRLENLPELTAEAVGLERKEGMRPMGLAVWQRDREAKDATVWVQPWLIDAVDLDEARTAAKIFFEDTD